MTTTARHWQPRAGTPLQRYRLMHQAEVIRAEYGLGLASVWGHINGGNYVEAQAQMDRVIEDRGTGVWPPSGAPMIPTPDLDAATA